MKIFIFSLTLLTRLHCQSSTSDTPPNLLTLKNPTDTKTQLQLNNEDSDNLEGQFEVQELFDGIEIPENIESTTAEEIELESPEETPILSKISKEEGIDLFEDPSKASSFTPQPEIIVKAPVSIETKKVYSHPENFSNSEAVFIRDSEEFSDQRTAKFMHMQHVSIAIDHLKNLEQQIRDAALETHQKNSTLMSPKALKLFDSFIANLDFLENPSPQNELPYLYDYFLDKNVTLAELQASLKVKRAQKITFQHEISGPQKPVRSFSPPNNKTIHEFEVLSSATYSQIPKYDFSDNIQEKLTGSSERKNQFQYYKLLHKQQTSFSGERFDRSRPRTADWFRPRFASRKLIKRRLPQNDPNFPNNNLTSSQNLQGKSYSEFMTTEIPILNIGTLPLAIFTVEQIQRFFMELFAFFPEPANISSSQFAENNEKIFKHYQQLHLFQQKYIYGIDGPDKNLEVLGKQFKELLDNQEDFWVFFGHSGFNSTASKQSFEPQEVLFRESISNILKMIYQCRADFNNLEMLVNWIDLPENDSQIFSESFRKTINYENLKLPKLVEAKIMIIQHLEDLKNNILILKAQQASINGLLGNIVIFNEAFRKMTKLTFAIGTLLLCL